jgi:DNA repair exonuclease SbcCD ATPase subunit
MDEIKGEIRSSQIANVTSAKELRQEIEGLKQQFVSVDKFNLLKIRMAELGEQFRRIDKVEKAVKEAEDRATDVTRLSKALDDLKAEMGQVDKTAKAAVTEGQMRKLVEEINAEFDAVKADVSRIEGKGGKVADLRIARFSEQVEAKLDELRAKTQRLQEVTAEQVKRPAVDALVGDINGEFDRVKDSVERLHDDLKRMRDDIKEIRREAALKDDVEEQLKQLRKTMTSLRSDMRDAPRSMVFPDEKPKTMLKEAFAKLGKRKEKVVVMDEPRPRSRLLTLSTIVIVLSFLGLAASVGVFFLGFSEAMDYLIVASIVLFVLGIILRVTALVKEEAETQ